MERKFNTWAEAENYLATDVINAAKKRAQKWRAAWLATFLALIVTNATWLYVSNNGRG